MRAAPGLIQRQPRASSGRVARLGRLAGLTISLILAACAFPQPKIMGTAIVFGASDYYGTSNDLAATKADAEAMDILLTAQGWDSRLFLDADATVARLKVELASLAGSAEPVLFYYAGHGVNDNEALLDEVSDVYLIPVDAIATWLDPSLRANMISSRDLHGWLVEYDIRHPILILDSCFSGGFIAEGPAYDGIPADYNPWSTTALSAETPPAFSQVGTLLAGALQAWQGYDSGSGAVVLAAAGLPEKSWEENEGSVLPYAGRGIFTWFLMTAATDPLADGDADGFVSTVEAYQYARTKLDEEWNRLHTGSPSMVYLPRQSGGLRDYLLFSQP